MPAKDWLVPLAVAAVAFAGLAALPDGGGGGHSPDDDGVDFVFPEAPRVPSPGRPATVLVLSRDPQPVDAVWRTPHVAMYESRSATAVCLRHAPCVATHEVAGPDEPRLGAGGYNGTRVTVHVFDADGELAFSNANASDVARLTRSYDPERLPTGTWYLGREASPPPGTQKLPPAAAAFLGRSSALIEGLPVGGVVSIETDALATWYGTLYVTLRIDELVHAP